MDSYIGQISMFAGNFAPRGWMLCNGQLLPIQQYSAVFAILGTTYGGDGQTNFGLPDLRSRGPVHASSGGVGTSPRQLGEMFGTESVTLMQHNMPAHNHVAPAASVQTSDKPGAGLAPAPGGSYGPATVVNGMAPGQVSGQNVPLGIAQPSLAVNFIICVEGIFPSRP